MKRIILAFILLTPTYLFGQVDFLKEKNLINSIKKDPAYVYGEGIGGSENEARKLAQDELVQQVNAYIREYLPAASADYLDMKLLVGNSCNILLKRGPNDRIFYYLEKSNIKEKPQPCKGQTQELTEKKQEEIEPVSVVTIDETSEEEPIEELTDLDIELEDPGEISGETSAISRETEDDSVLSKIQTIEDVQSLVNYLNISKTARKVMWGEVKGEVNPGWYVAVISGNEIEAILDKGDTRRKDLRSDELKNLKDFSNKRKIWFIVYE